MTTDDKEEEKERETEKENKIREESLKNLAEKSKDLTHKKPELSDLTVEQEKKVKKETCNFEFVKNKNKNKNSEKDPKEKETIVYKYSNKSKGQLREACIIEGKPYFLKYSEERDCLQLEPYIDEETRRLTPPHIEEYAYEPYEFKDVNESNRYLLRTKKQTIDSLYKKVKSYVRLFNDIDERTLNLLSADIVGSFFQDRFSTLHYLIIVGDNGTGKSAFGDTFECIGYRAVNVTNTTEAFWFRIFGTSEPGQVTIIAEEVDKLDENSQIMSVLKVGYQPNAKVPRMNNENDKMDFYYPFCFKIMIAERSPNEDKAKGLLDKSFKIKTYKGSPEFKIKEIRNPQGNKLRQKLLDEIEDLRKLLLVFKLIHFKDPYKEVDIGLDGRDEELCKPLLQLFYTLGAYEGTLKELEETLQHFLNIKNNRKENSLEAVIYPILVNVISKYGLTPETGQIWKEITESLDGQPEEKNQNLFHSPDYDDLYRNTITKLICDKFGGEIKHTRNGNVIILDPDYIAKVGKIYDDAREIKTRLVNIDGDSCDACDALLGNDHVTNVPISDDNNEDLSTNLEENESSIDTKKGPHLPTSASNESHGSPDQDQNQNQNQEYPPSCYYCDEYFDGIGKKAYEKHVIKGHPGKLCYPGPADIELHQLTPKGMRWEV